MMRLFVLAALVCPLTSPAARAQPVWHNDTGTCRRVTDAILNGRVNAAADALMPENASAVLRRDIRNLMQRLVSSAVAVSDGLPPRLERDLPDFTVQDVPASLQLWSFGDRKAYLVGCGIRPEGEFARVSVQAYPTQDDTARHLAEALFGSQPPPGADGE